MQSRCCCPPDSPSALSPSRSLTSSQSAAPRRLRSTASSRSDLRLTPWILQAVGDVLVDRLGERVGLLEHHPDLLAQAVDLEPRVEDVAPLEVDRALGPHAVDQVVHPVEAAQKRRLAAAGGADEGRDPVPRDLHRDVVERLLLPVPEREALDRQQGVGHLRVQGRVLGGIERSGRGGLGGQAHRVRLRSRQRGNEFGFGRHGSRLRARALRPRSSRSAAAAGCGSRWPPGS